MVVQEEFLLLVCSLEAIGKFDFERRVLTLANHQARHIRRAVLTFLAELHVKPLRHHRDKHFHHMLGKSLAKTNSSAPVERQPAHCVPLLTVWSGSQGMGRIKSIG